MRSRGKPPGCLCLAVLLLCFAISSEATHFRGGIISCGPNPSSNGGFDDNGNVVLQCDFRIAWRLSAYCQWQGLYCNPTDIDPSIPLQGPNGASTYLSCTEGCSGNFKDLQYYSTEYSPKEEEDWSQGGRIFNYTFSGAPARFRASYEGCCWISTLVRYRDTGWVWPFSMNLTQRTDTGMINHSPRSAQIPIVRMQYGCGQNLSIHTDDPDNDIVRCRWCKDYSECGGVFPPLFNAILISNPCTIMIPPTLETGTSHYHAVAIVLEDFVLSDPNGPALSQVPLQFLLDVYKSNVACTTRPEFAPPSPVDKRCIPIKPGTQYNATLRVRETSQFNRIRDFTLTSPIGMVKGPIRQFSENGAFYSEMWVKWTPNRAQYGQHVLCCLAEDSQGQTTPQICVTLLAGASAPEIIPGTAEPSMSRGKTAPYVRATFSVDFDQQILRPLQGTTAAIRINEVKNGTVVRPAVFSLSPHDAILKQHPLYLNHYQLIFYVTTKLKIDATYSITMDNGFVVGQQSCTGGGAPFFGIQDPNRWQFVADHTVGNISDCGRNSSQFFTYGTRVNDTQLLLGNGTSCVTRQLANSANGFPINDTQHNKVTICENGV
eukprot:scpid64066/ scgid0794/ 